MLSHLGLHNLSFKAKLLALVLSSIVFTVVVGLWFAISLEKKTLHDVQVVTVERASETLRSEWIAETRAFSSTLADLLVQPTYALDLSTINNIVKSTQQQDPIRYIVVVDDELHVLGSGEPERYPIGILLTQLNGSVRKLSHSWQMVDTAKVLEIISPIKLADEILGAVVIGFYIEGIEADILKMADDIAGLHGESSRVFISALLVYGVLAILVGAVLAYVIARHTVHPILSLVKQTGKIAQGEYDLELDLKRKDEIGLLNDSVLQMTRKLVRRESSLQKAKEELETRIKERTAEMEQSNSKLMLEMEEHRVSVEARRELEQRLQRAQKMEALGTLAGGVAHDLNNILTGLVGYPQLVLLDLPEDSRIRPHIETIRTSGEKAAAIVQDLLTLARRGVMQQQVCNLNDILSELLNSPEWDRIQEAHPHVLVSKDLSTDLLNINGSEIHLSKALMNLLNNAVESIMGNGTVRISTENRYVSTPIGQYEDVLQGEYAVVTIVDTGIGIEKDDLPKIFEPFFTKKEMGRSGTGLGMAVVWGTVKDHAGYIDVRSNPGEGTQFDLYFPAVDKNIDNEVDTPALADYKGSERILVVDDDDLQRHIANEFLAQLGYSVVRASSGEEALACCKSQDFDLVILDMIMGEGMDGLETYIEICKMTPGMKAIITSGFSESGRVKEAQRLGAGPYLKKPYQLLSLAVMVKMELGKE